MVGKAEKGVDASEVLRDSHPFPEVSEVLEPQKDSRPALEASEELEALKGTRPVLEVSEEPGALSDSRPALEASEEPEALRGSHPDPEDVVLEAVIRRDLVEYRRDSRESRMADTVLALEVLAEVKARVCGNKRSPA